MTSRFEPTPSALLADLLRPSAYPDDPSAAEGVCRVQTHISNVFLTRDRVYKLRKAVDLGFVRFATLAQRNTDCVRELVLNRRLAPDVYLGVAPLVRERDAFRVGDLAETIAPSSATREHCVVMRRLPDRRDALSLLERGRLRTRHVDAVAERVARFHEAHRLGGGARPARAEWLAHCTDPVRANVEALTPAAGVLLPRATLERVARLSSEFARAHADRFEARRRAGPRVGG